MINQLQELEASLQVLKDERVTEVAECDKELQAIESRIEQANRELVEADLKGDGPAYVIAKDNKRTNEDLKEFFTSKRNRLEKETVISEDEYNKNVKEATSLMDGYNDKQLKKVAELLKQIEAIADETLEARNTTDNILKTLQYDLFKHEGQGVSSGGLITVPNDKGGTTSVGSLYYRGDTVTTLLNGIKEFNAYSQLKGDR